MMKKQFMDDFENNGWAVIPQVFNKSEIDTVIDEFNSTKHIYNFYQDKRGIGEETANSSHHTHLTVPTMWSLLDNDIVEYVVNEAFQGPAIINTMGLSEVTNQGVYTQKIHRDVRTNTGHYRLYLNTLIMLDDSTEENGATWIMPQSHKCDKAPSEDLFFRESKRAIGKKGDLLVFDCNLWHALEKILRQTPDESLQHFFRVLSSNNRLTSRVFMVRALVSACPPESHNLWAITQECRRRWESFTNSLRIGFINLIRDKNEEPVLGN
jgi:hypothetical protein